MKPSEKNAFFEIMGRASRLYQREINVDVGEIMYQALTRYTISEIADGLTAHMSDPKRGKYFPTPADIIEKIKQRPATPAGKTFCQAIELGSPCKNEAVVNAKFGGDADCYVCYEHWDRLRRKTDVERKIDSSVKQFTQYAEQASMTNKQFFDEWFSGATDKQKALASSFVNSAKTNSYGGR